MSERYDDPDSRRAGKDSAWPGMALLMLVLFVVAVGALKLCTQSRPRVDLIRQQSPQPAIGYPLRGVRVIDGDTLQADIVMPWGVALVDQHVRCMGYDAWECTTRRQTVEVDEAELAKGRAAKGELETLLDDGDVRLTPVSGKSRDAYGRVLGRLTVGTVDVASWMEQRGHVRIPNSQFKDD